VAVKVTDSQGASNVAYATVVVGDHKPIANPGGPYQGAAGSTLVLDGSASNDVDPGDRLSYAWDLQGNGQFADGSTARVNFTVPNAVAKTASVCLRVTDASGRSDTACTTVVSTSAPPPLADAGGGFTHSYSGRVDQAILLDASASADPLGQALSFSWSAAGGVLSGANSAKPSVSFSAAGTYFVTVTVSTGVGSAMATASVVVGP